MVRDLHALLINAGVPDPYVLVGQSFGGLVIQLYASTHPREVAGMVLVDGSHPAFYFANRDYYTANASQFDIDLLKSAEQTRMAGPWPVVPLVVLSRGLPAPAIPGGEEQWAAGQAELAARMPNSTHRIVADAGHNIHTAQPLAVINAIHEVVESARRGPSPRE
jgi:pimeloyl-ACP methyl ester carboxylesterase